MGGDFVLAKPCEHCQVLIEAANIKEIFWTNNNGGVDHETR
jgi:deoxycytidylate deaminase